MRYTWIDDFLLNKRGVTKDLQAEWNWIRYHVGGKMFAAICLGENNEPYYITLKLDPCEGDFLRQQYEDIIPGYYMNKVHWNSIKPDGEVPDEFLMDLLEKSYELVLGGFSKKKQREIIGLSCCGTDCTRCSFYGNMCQGCNETGGKVFHAPKGKACPIYACAVQQNKRANCARCDQLPCEIWMNTRDPQMSEEQFLASVQERIDCLKNKCELI
ncbi:MAG: hypothetical protein PWP24_661 [Clostridiales bacterium]|nr:hypothetical protein [Clostridiales bacterium]